MIRTALFLASSRRISGRPSLQRLVIVRLIEGASRTKSGPFAPPVWAGVVMMASYSIGINRLRPPRASRSGPVRACLS